MDPPRRHWSSRLRLMRSKRYIVLHTKMRNRLQGQIVRVRYDLQTVQSQGRIMDQDPSEVRSRFLNV
ncbi:uncharacterized protein N7484_002084 [Penicillium longicatenatum]|uniref:uncharacterized protein n=1 Tax=Penicillium longicatenatum TaxID=1561947 RepID=UPI002547A5A1|nr:uncharacterized protein N7484_002084 [Penicillium longicatenatum]KAJ5658435.1 hypothetical protein N7484_002084 [Penicillium longicatenatum]KAJ5664107.1 hypothetical protein N7507_004838 [Penicillium longicatenatum]